MQVYGKGGVSAWLNTITGDLYISLDLRRALSYLSDSYKKTNANTRVVKNME